MRGEFSDMTAAFLGLTGDECSYDRSRYVILPVGYEKTTTFGRGTAAGPRAIISASQEVELYDEELRIEPYRSGIITLKEIEITEMEPEDAVGRIATVAKNLLDDKKFIITLGGEHTVSVGLVRAYAKAYPDLSVLQIDAHADLRETYQGWHYSHACTMRRIRDIVNITVGVGIRSMSAEESRVVEREAVPTFFASDVVGNDTWHESVIECLSDHVYLTIDLDGFDPSIMPGVGTPEPGGLGWYESLKFLRKLCMRKELVGFDVVELMPIKGSLVSEFTAAKLIYKLVGYIE